MASVLLTVSGTIKPEVRAEVAAGKRPRPDYLEMARAFDADLIDYAEAHRSRNFVGHVLAKLGGRNLLLAYECFRRRGRYRAIFTDGEQIGIPVALMLKLLGRGPLRTRHLMIAHLLSVGKKVLFFDLCRIQTHIDRCLVYSTWQQRFAERRLRMPAARVEFTPFMVDTRFFSPEQAAAGPAVSDWPDAAGSGPILCAVGMEFRDYPTLMAAVDGLPVRVVVAAGSPWSKRSDSTRDREIPANVLVRRFSQFDLRQLYADSSIVVIPLYAVDFQAGVTAILEGMAMERPVVCSRTAGQTDVIVDGESGVYVPVGDPAALRAAIERLLADPDEAARIGRAGQELVRREMNLDLYAERLARTVSTVLAEG